MDEEKRSNGSGASAVQDKTSEKTGSGRGEEKTSDNEQNNSLSDQKKATTTAHRDRSESGGESEDDHDDGVYEEVKIEDMDYDEEEDIYTYQCPCGDLFFIATEDLESGEDIAHCPSCSLIIRVIYNPEDFGASMPTREDDADNGSFGAAEPRNGDSTEGGGTGTPREHDNTKDRATSNLESNSSTAHTGRLQKETTGALGSSNNGIALGVS
mmetsp:Transcript_34687/g.83931  ORF Transcript_34687/g.83931 Transcript_34687/m.83931 type:complete len:212 (+) Transcript_34687:109-744(+)